MEGFLDEEEREDLLERLRDIVSFRYENMEFYRDLYSSEDLEIDSFSDFRQLPALTREDVEKMPESDLPVTGADEAQIIGGHPTSGTASGDPHLFFRSRKDLEVEKEDRRVMLEESIPEDSRTVVVMAPHLAPRIMNFLRGEGRFAVTGDPYELEGAREMIEDVEADVLFTTPSNALKLGKMMKEKGPDPAGIERVITGGERLSDMVQETLKEIFQAEIAESYGSAETQHIGDQCTELYGTGKYHVNTGTRYYEVIDPETGEVCEPGEEGELVVTVLYRNSGIPFTRYRTGDLALIEENPCDCSHSDMVLEVRGRVEFETITLKGIHLSRQEFEEALEHASAYTTGKYQIHVYEEDIEDDIKPMIEVHLEPRREFTDTEKVERKVEEKLGKALKVTDTHTWNDAVEEGLFKPMDVVLDSNLEEGGKTTKIIDHR